MRRQSSSWSVSPTTPTVPPTRSPSAPDGWSSWPAPSSVEPDLLFLDEPSSGLDHRETDEMATVLEQVQRERGTAMLLCEHDVAFVERLASRTYVLDVGKLIAEGPTSEVLARPEVVTAYLGQEQ